MATIGELIPTRRELLRFGGAGIIAAAAQAVWPLPAHADSTRKTTPRGCAKNVIFFELAGALSHVESFDFKENPATLKEWENRPWTEKLWEHTLGLLNSQL